MTEFEQMNRTCGNVQISSIDRDAMAIGKTIMEITKRGNDAEVRTCREGLKILEVKKRVAIITSHG